jgi:hypothetical protein
MPDLSGVVKAGASISLLALRLDETQITSPDSTCDNHPRNNGGLSAHLARRCAAMSDDERRPGNTRGDSWVNVSVLSYYGRHCS